MRSGQPPRSGLLPHVSQYRLAPLTASPVLSPSDQPKGPAVLLLLLRQTEHGQVLRFMSSRRPPPLGGGATAHPSVVAGLVRGVDQKSSRVAHGGVRGGIVRHSTAKVSLGAWRQFVPLFPGPAPRFSPAAPSWSSGTVVSGVHHSVRLPGDPGRSHETPARTGALPSSFPPSRRSDLRPCRAVRHQRDAGRRNTRCGTAGRM